MRKKILSLCLAGLMICGLAACGSSSSSDVSYIKKKGKLTVGITDFQPMDYKDSDGNWIGFDADMATQVAKDLGVDVEFVEIDWDNKILELKNKSIDCVWNGMTLTDEVTKSMNCTRAYCNNAQVVVVKSSDADKYKDVDSLKNLKFAVEEGSAGEKAAKANDLNRHIGRKYHRPSDGRRHGRRRHKLSGPHAHGRAHDGEIRRRLPPEF